jgi:hypothetical protein
LHFAHNAEFASEYPNLARHRGTIYLVWLGIAAIGAVGFALWRGYQIAGLA